jgi:hypothetical protein
LLSHFSKVKSFHDLKKGEVMKTKILKCLMFVSLTIGASSVLAQSFMPGPCSPMSKNPKCWEGQDHTKPPRPAMCSTKNSCEMINNIQQDSSGNYRCKAVSGLAFSCNTLVEQFGTHLEGVVVKVTTPYVDGCHVLGG